MKRQYILAVLFFSGLWGISEAVLGGVLYRANVPYASVPLTVAGFVILSFATVYFPQKGTATFIAALAMLYKFLNTPFFACHLLGILIMGVSYDLFFSIISFKNRSLSAIAATYLSYALFGIMITYVFRYSYWAQEGLAKVIRHIGIGGSMAALGCAVLVPLSYRLGQKLRANHAAPFAVQPYFVSGCVYVVTIGLWTLGLATYVLSH
jgi:hypothetical protein